jgi:hypothetical protein
MDNGQPGAGKTKRRKAAKYPVGWGLAGGPKGRRSKKRQKTKAKAGEESPFLTSDVVVVVGLRH